MDVSKRAKVLIQAMPYIKKYSGETIVVKYGGNAMINEELKAAVMSDLVLMQLVGVNVVLVHGGGPEINAMLKAVGKESKFINGMRVTDKETIDIVQMVLAGKVNKSLVQLLGSHGGKAMGLCGLDGRMLMAEKLVTGADLGYVGEIKEVNPSQNREKYTRSGDALCCASRHEIPVRSQRHGQIRQPSSACKTADSAVKSQVCENTPV